jgi:mono/diheme cytochrome c family protein
MPRTVVRLLVCALALALLAGCGGGENIYSLPADTSEQERQGAEIFVARCAACHSLSVVGAKGSAFNVNRREYKDGPNFDVRAAEYDQVLYAIRNGGFSSGPMPQNIAVGEEAEAVAAFVSRFAGQEAERPESPGRTEPAGADGSAGGGESP